MEKRKEWKAVVEFVPFESERAGDEAYRNWARLFLQAKKLELESRVEGRNCREQVCGKEDYEGH